MQSVEIYTTPFCGYCLMAKRLLSSKDIPFVELDVSGDPELRGAMIERAGGLRSVPQIFVGGTHVGGCAELYALDQAGRLDPLLAA
jgi:glutaredoxin 3